MPETIRMRHCNHNKPVNSLSAAVFRRILRLVCLTAFLVLTGTSFSVAQPAVSKQDSVMTDLIVAIDALFREHGIVIPFPQQDVHIRSSEGLQDKSPE